MNVIISLKQLHRYAMNQPCFRETRESLRVKFHIWVNCSSGATVCKVQINLDVLNDLYNGCFGSFFIDGNKAAWPDFNEGCKRTAATINVLVLYPPLRVRANIKKKTLCCCSGMQDWCVQSRQSIGCITSITKYTCLIDFYQTITF